MTYYRKKKVSWLDRDGFLLPGEKDLASTELKRREREKFAEIRRRYARPSEAHMREMKKLREILKGD